MSKTPLYKMLQDVPSSGGWTLATLLDGSVSGSQLLLQAGKPVWQAGPADFMRRDLSGLLCLPFEQALKQVPGSAETYFIVVTRAHAFDVICLEQILRKPAAYVGMMGSRGRSALVRRQLLEKGLEEKRVEALYAPIGLSIGSQTAEEIALSILAQVVSIKNARSQTEGFSSAILDAMAQADHTGQRAVLAVITARHSSTPREAGAKMLVLADGTVVGSVGGGIMEHRTILAAQEMLAGNTPAQQLMHFSADGKDEDAAAAACGGSMEIWLAILQAGEELK